MNGKGKLFVGLAAALLAGGPAAGALGSNRASAPIDKHNESCGQPEKEPHEIGVIKFKRVRNRVTLTVKLHHAGKEDSYRVFLMDAATCSSVGFAVAIDTNRNGVGHGQGSVTLEGEAATHTQFFGNAVRAGESGPEPSDTTIVTLD